MNTNSSPFEKNEIEKNLNKTSETVQVWKLTFWKIQFFILNLKNKRKKPINNSEFDFILVTIPFLLGFFQFIFTKYHNQSFFYFFEKNLPGIFLPTENLEWETFFYIQSKKFNNITIKKIELFDKNILLTLNPMCKSTHYIGTFSEKDRRPIDFIPNQAKTYLINQPNLIDFSLKKIKNTQKFGLKLRWHELSSQSLPKFTSLSKKNTFFILPNSLKQGPKDSSLWLRNFSKDYVKIFYTNLDELPFKLDSINISNQDIKSQTEDLDIKSQTEDLDIKSQPEDLDLKPPVEDLDLQSSLFNIENQFEPQAEDLDLQSYNPLDNRENIFDFIKPIFSNSKNNKFESKNKNLTLLIPTFSQNPQTLAFKKSLKENQLKVLKTEIKQPVESNIPFDRTFEFEKENFYPNREEFFENREKLKNYLKDIFYNTGLLPIDLLQKFNQKPNKFIDFSILTLFESQKKLKNNENFVVTENNDSILYLKNIFTDLTEIDVEESFLDELLTIIDQYIVPPEQYFLSFRSHSGYKYPDTTKKQLEKSFIRIFVKEFFSKKIAFKHKIQNPFSMFLKIQIPETFLSNFSLEEKGFQPSFLDKIQFFQVPWNQISLEDNGIQKIYASGFYKNETSIYDNTLISNKSNSFLKKIKNYFLFQSQISFQTFWEPLTLQSWLIVTKISLAFFAFKLLRNIYTNYLNELSLLADLLSALGLIDEETKKDLFSNKNEKGFRILKTKKKFQEIAGIENIVPELGEIVWFLRNSGRVFQVGNAIPKGILLIGPPGTGKTLLVQAIAGEAQVPVLTLSGSSLYDPEKPGASRLKSLFKEARKVAPCIVFIDEIDTLGEKRRQVMKTLMGSDEIIESISESNFLEKVDYFTDYDEFLPKSQNDENLKTQSDIFDFHFVQQKKNQRQLALLMQFLVEMDGLKLRNKIIVIGATNRPDVLDSAFLRPGRFDKVIEFGLPEKEKRIEILKLYSSPLGTDLKISWDYFAHRTSGLSAADLAAIMNESAMRAIMLNTVHNLETIERGIDRVTSFSTENVSFTKKTKQDPFFLSRLAYYQAGKALVHSLLPNHPDMVVVHLWPRTKNIRSLRITNTVQKEISLFSRREEIEDRIIGFYAGKASELFVLGRNSEKASQTNNFSTFWLSNLGYEDLNFANYLVYLMSDKWYFYSKQIASRKLLELELNKNQKELGDLNSPKIDRFKQRTDQIENPTSNLKKLVEDEFFAKYGQNRNLPSAFQSQTSYELKLLKPVYTKWYRLYLPDPQEWNFNAEWIPPDEFYHNNLLINIIDNSKQEKNWNDFYERERDYILHGLILNCFNKALNFLENNREILDYLAHYLLKHEILREHDLQSILLRFGKKSNLKNINSASSDFALGAKEKSITDFKSKDLIGIESSKNELFDDNLSKKFLSQRLEPFEPNLLKNKKKQLITRSWGTNSCRKISRFINFEHVKLPAYDVILEDVILEDVPNANCPLILKVIKNLTALTFKQARKLITSLPKTIKQGVSKEEAEVAKQQLEEVGGKVKIQDFKKK
jgi:ATP-dependent Zn protease